MKLTSLLKNTAMENSITPWRENDPQSLDGNTAGTQICFDLKFELVAVGCVVMNATKRLL